jgi:hypothetical protein
LTGLKTPFRDGYVRDLAEEVLKLAKVSKLECFAMVSFFFSLKQCQVQRNVRTNVCVALTTEWIGKKRIQGGRFP